ncbi:MAG: hypothetical protein KH354_03890 [Clostridiales bacterium]|nr:hypothetical protein [Clostridiales bacterium]
MMSEMDYTDGSKKKRRPDKTAQTEPGDNRKYLLHSLRIARMSPVTLSDAAQVSKRVYEYFDICAEDDMKPSVAGLALALSTDRRRLWEMRERETKGAAVADILKKTVQILDLQMVDYMQNGKINPASGIFLMKNNFGYSNQQELVVAPQNPLGRISDQQQLFERIDATIADDTSYDE